MRAWILGNGESLRKTPLDKLAAEVTYSTGRINLLFKTTDWRPKYYVMAEPPGFRNEAEMRNDFRVISREVEICHFQAGLVNLAGAAPPKCRFYYFTTCKHVYTGAPESWHLPEICSYGSSVHVALQIATLEGYSPLYLVGCDLTGGHFTDGYGDSLVQTEVWRKAHEVASRSGVEIYNATIGGELEVYPRVNLEEVLWQ